MCRTSFFPFFSTSTLKRLNDALGTCPATSTSYPGSCQLTQDEARPFPFALWILEQTVPGSCHLCSKSLATLKLLLRGTGPSWSWIAEVQPPTSALISSEVSHQPAPDQHSQPSKPLGQGPCSTCYSPDICLCMALPLLCRCWTLSLCSWL